LLAEISAREEDDRECAMLDQALVDLAQGRPDQAEQLLQKVRDRFDYLEQESLAESTLTMLTDETRAAYAGEDYEQVLIRAMLAISSLMQDSSEAVPYCLQVDQKQRQIIERRRRNEHEQPQPGYNHVALGAYLSGIVQEESHRNHDDVERAFAAVALWEPSFTPAKFDLARARSGVHSARGNGVVYVFALVGRGPYKVEGVAEATSDALLIADRILSAAGDHTLPPTIAPVKIPEVVVPYNVVDSIAVDIDDRPAGLTCTVTDVGRLALAQHEATRNHVLARAVARRIVKKAAVYSAKDALEVDQGWASFAFDAAGVVWEATEVADTRCWGVLPERIQVLRLELPAGSYSLGLRPARNGKPIGPSSRATLDVADGRNTYVLASFPGPRLAGKVVVSGTNSGYELDRR
jgi:hypothetical protein